MACIAATRTAVVGRVGDRVHARGCSCAAAEKTARSDPLRRERYGPANMFERARGCGRCSRRHLLLLLVAVLHGGVWSLPTENNDNNKVTVENISTVSKRQINFHSSQFNQQQIPQDYVDYTQQTNAASNQNPQFEQTGPQVFIPRLQSDEFPPTTTTTLTPFGAEQVRLQTEYANRAVAEQLANEQQRSRPRTFAQPPPRFQVQPVSQLLQLHRQPHRFPDESEQALRQREIGPDPQRDFGPAPSGESYSYAQVRIGPVSETGHLREHHPLVARPKGQRSVSGPRANRPAPEQAVQQTIDHPTTIFPVQFSPRLLQNVVYVRPNGQVHKPVEDAEHVVEIPRRNYFYGLSPEPATSAPVTVAPAVTAPTPPVTSAPANPADDEPLVLIPRLKKPDRPTGKIRQDGRKTGKAQQQQSAKTARPQQLRQQSEVEPDNFLTSLLYRLQQQHQQDPDGPEEPTAAPRQRGGQRWKGAGDRPDASKYLPDRNQLQLLQFPHELRSLSSAELRALENAGARIAAADDQFVGQKRLPKNRPAAVSGAKQSPPPEALPAEPFDGGEQNGQQSAGNRPVPTPVELNEQQREFLAAQGIRNLYRVDYDQSGNALPLTYVLALDNRPKRAEHQRLSATATSSDTNIKNN